MHERRRDSRANPHFSLRNLFSTRAQRDRFSLAVLGTHEGVLMAGSQEDRAAQRCVAHAADQLAAAGRFACEGRRTGGRLSGLRMEVGGKPLVLAVLDAQPRARGEGMLNELAARVRSILS